MAQGQKRKLLILLTSLFLYLIIGAAIFWKVEEGPDRTTELLKKVYAEEHIGGRNLTFEKFFLIMKEVKHVFEISHFGETWTLYSSLYFCGSVVTTIGYGHMTPKTPAGRVIVMFYAIIGIPLNLWTLKVMGDTITSLLMKIISKIEKKVFKKQDEKHLKLKVVAAMAILNIAMLLLGGAMYKWSENWTYLEGVYYCFIVYSTIGFGDLVPSEGHSVGQTNNDIVMMFVRAFNLIIGLSLLSSLLSSIIHAADDLRVVFPKISFHKLLKRNRIVALNRGTAVDTEHIAMNEQRAERTERNDNDERGSSIDENLNSVAVTSASAVT